VSAWVYGETLLGAVTMRATKGQGNSFANFKLHYPNAGTILSLLGEKCMCLERKVEMKKVLNGWVVIVQGLKL